MSETYAAMIGVLMATVVMAAMWDVSSLYVMQAMIVMTTLGLHGVRCLYVIATGLSVCETTDIVLGQVAGNLAAVTGAWVVMYIGLAIIKRILGRL